MSIAIDRMTRLCVLWHEYVCVHFTLAVVSAPRDEWALCSIVFYLRAVECPLNLCFLIVFQMQHAADSRETTIRARKQARV